MAQVSFYKINSSQLNSLSIAEGQIIFAQDIGELYIDKDSSNRVKIGGNSLEHWFDGTASGSVRTSGSMEENLITSDSGIRSNYFLGQDAVAEGRLTMAPGYYSHSEGSMTIASLCGHAEGSCTAAVGNYSHAEGIGEDPNACLISGDASSVNYTFYGDVEPTVGKFIINIANGKATKIIQTNYIDSETYEIQVTNTLSNVALNMQPAMIINRGIAYGEGAHIEGAGSRAEGYGSHAEGVATITTGYGSHAEGYFTIASGNYSHVQGKYNIDDVNNIYAHIIGNGTANNARSNAHTIDWQGNAWFAGNIKIGGTSYDDSNAKTLIAGAASSTNLGGLKVRYDSATQTLYIRNDGNNA